MNDISEKLTHSQLLLHKQMQETLWEICETCSEAFHSSLIFFLTPLFQLAFVLDSLFVIFLFTLFYFLSACILSFFFFFFECKEHYIETIYFYIYYNNSLSGISGVLPQRKDLLLPCPRSMLTMMFYICMLHPRAFILWNCSPWSSGVHHTT